MRILIIGGVAGGATAAARLRRLDECAEIVMFERGEYISFANCGLPYYIGGEIEDRSDLLLQTPTAFFERFNVDVRVFHEVIEIDRVQRKIVVKNLKSNEIYFECYDKLILSPGSYPIKPNIDGINSGRVFTLRNIADTDLIKNYIKNEKPRDAVVVGGGFIGIEMCENLTRLGLGVSLIELSNQILPPIDGEMAAIVQSHITKQGVKLFLNNGLQAISENGKRLNLRLSQGQIECDMVVLAIGVKADSDLAKHAGLALNGHGGIIVDRHMCTSDKNIYAVGDAAEVFDRVTGEKTMLPLAAPANKQARLAADSICNINREYSGVQGSAIIKVFDLTVATTGINEKTVKRLNLCYDKVYLNLPSHAGYYPHGKNMQIKTVFDKKSGKILGAQIIGYNGVDKRCDVLATAIRASLTAFDLTELDLCYAPPYSSAKDPVNMIGFVIENVLLGYVKNFHFDEVDNLPDDGSITLIDTRTAREYGLSHIKGAINIPLNRLRSNIEKLDKEKPVYIYCHSGMRSYIGSRILLQKGFDVYNLSGGYLLYSNTKKQG